VARNTKPTVKAWHDDDVAATLNTAEGALSDLRGKPPDYRPAATVETYLMQRYRCSRVRMKERIADAHDNVRRRRKGYDLAANWLETLRLIGDELCEKLYTKTADIAFDTNNRNAFNAQKFLIERNESVFEADTLPAAQQAPTHSMVSEIEQEVFDAMTDVEEAQLTELIEAEASIKIKLGHLLRRIQKRLADQRVADDDAYDEIADADDA